MNFWKFSIFTFVGSFPWSLGLAYGGFKLGENWEDLRSVMRPFDIPIIVVIVLVAAWFFYRRIRAVRAQSSLDSDVNPEVDAAQGDNTGSAGPK